MKLTYQNQNYKISFHTEAVDHIAETGKEVFVWYPFVKGFAVCVEPDNDVLHFLFANTKKELIGLIKSMSNDSELYFINTLNR